MKKITTLVLVLLVCGFLFAGGAWMWKRWQETQVLRDMRHLESTMQELQDNNKETLENLDRIQDEFP